MRTRQILFILSIAILATVLSGGPAGATGVTFVEDFTTTPFKDAVNTTAYWDTVTGNLKLYPLPKLTGSYDTPGTAFGVAVSGNYAFVADYSSGFLVIDISDPANPALADIYATAGDAYNVTVSGDYAFVAVYASGLQVVNISAPTIPWTAGSYDTPGYAMCVTVSGDHAFVADYSHGLQVIDISDPANPTLAGSYDTPGYALGVTVSGDHAFVADDVSGLQVIDISDPTNPALAGSYDTPGYARNVAVSGDHAFVADRDLGLQVIDISDPTNPTLAGSYDTPSSAYGVAIAGDHAFVADYYSGLLVIDILDPANPVLAGGYDTPGSAFYVTVSGDDAFVADYDSGLQVIDISDLTTPTVEGSYDTPDNPYGLAISGNYAFVTGFTRFGLQVIDISDPANPTLAGSYDSPGSEYGTVVSGDHAFVANWTSGLLVVDISDPANPTFAGSCDTPGSSRNVTVSGDHAFVADRDFGLQVVNISDPTNPTLAGSYDTPGDAGDVAVSGNHAYVTDEASGLQVIDISDPTNPVLAGSYDTPGGARGIDISGNRAYVADNDAGFLVISIANPVSPMLVGSYDTQSNAYDVAISGDHAFVTDYFFGLNVIDISDPTNPTLVDSLEASGNFWRVIVSGDHAFLTNYLTGLQVIRVSQTEVDTDNNVGQSLVVDASSDTIVAVSLTTTQTNTVNWELSADGGANWQGVAPDGGWKPMTVAGNDLLWRSTHAWAAAGINPAVSEVEIGMLYRFPIIVSSGDIPNDQGGYVLLEWDPSGHDIYDLRTVTHYSVWRALHPTSAAMPAGMGVALCTPADIEMEFEGPAVRAEGGYYWEWLTNMTAHYFDGYAYAAPTYYDSIGGDPALHYFQVIAHTSDQWTFWTSYPDSGYSVDNLSPAQPQALAGEQFYTPEGLQLTWDPNVESDLAGYRIYRGTTSDFVPDVGNLVATPTTEGWLDDQWRWDTGWWYKVSAIDVHGNESPFAVTGPDNVTGAGTPSVPTEFALGQNVPNPFNPTTTIRYDVPAGGGTVTLQIYDVSGRLVRTLVDAHQTPGSKSVLWNGTNNIGRGVSSGVYFYRMEAPGFSHTRKMLLLR